MRNLGIQRSGASETPPDENDISRSALGRRGLLSRALGIGGLAAVGGLAAACSSDDDDSTSTSASKGPERLIMWAAPNIGDWNTPIDVGFKEYCKQVGWKYQKIGQANQDPPATVQAILTAVSRKPAAIIMTVDTPNVYSRAVDAAVEAGIYVGIMTAYGDKEYIQKTYPKIGYVGASDYLLGLQMGNNIVDGLRAAGKTSGIVLSGNPQAGSATSEARIKGIGDAFSQAGATGLKHEVFVSDSKNATQSASDWTVRVNQGGSDVVALAPLQVADAVIAQSVLARLSKDPGAIPMWSIDIDSQMIDMINKGWVIGTVDQQFWLQGYLSAANAWASIERFTTPAPETNTGSATVTKDNIADVSKGIDIVEDLAKTLN